MYLGTKYEEERRIREKRKKEGSRCVAVATVTRQISTLILGVRKSELSKSCLWTRCSTKEYVVRNTVILKVGKSESRISFPCVWTMPYVRVVFVGRSTSCTLFLFATPSAEETNTCKDIQ